MNSKDIEARLDRSLENQIAVPRLDRRFDAAVWARIEAAQAPATGSAARSGRDLLDARPSRAVRASRWLAITNTIGISVALGVALYFLLRTFGGVDIPANALDAAVPSISEDMVTRITAVLGQVLGIAALAFGLSFTSFGRRIRASFS
jgi:hypothetical protein